MPHLIYRHTKPAIGQIQRWNSRPRSNANMIVKLRMTAPRVYHGPQCILTLDRLHRNPRDRHDRRMFNINSGKYREAEREAISGYEVVGKRMLSKVSSRQAVYRAPSASIEIGLHTVYSKEKAASSDFTALESSALVVLFYTTWGVLWERPSYSVIVRQHWVFFVRLS